MLALKTLACTSETHDRFSAEGGDHNVIIGMTKLLISRVIAEGGEMEVTDVTPAHTS